MVPLRMLSRCLWVLTIALTARTAGGDEPRVRGDAAGASPNAGPPSGTGAAADEPGVDPNRGSEAAEGAALKEEQEERERLRGSSPGALKSPIRLDSEARVARLCADLEVPSRAERSGDAFERGQARHERKIRRRDAMLAVYSAIIEPARFELDDYRFAEQRLPLKLDKALVTLDGALTLAIVRRRAPSFRLDPKEARYLAAQFEKRRAALKIVFRLESDAPKLSPCFTYPKSAAYAMRATPLAFEIIEGEHVLASVKTSEMTRLEAFLEPGPAVVRTSAESATGEDDAILTEAVDKVKGEIKTCLKPVLSSESETALLAFTAVLRPSGELRDLRLEISAIEGRGEVVPCIERILASISVPKPRGAAEVRIAVSVDRGREGPDEDASD